MFHRLCIQCMNSCKQDETVKIMKCPRFQKRLSDNEFRDLIGELDTMEADADRLRERIRGVIDTALSPPVDDRPEHVLSPQSSPEDLKNTSD